jgi:soluble lytic murein transglycosylase-like protein
MIDNRPIQPTHLIRNRWIYLLAIVPIIANYSFQHSQQERMKEIEISVSYSATFESPFEPDIRDLREFEPERERSASNEEQVSKDPYMPIILAAANQYKVDPAIIRAIIMAESSYNPKAISSRGARGLMQLMPRTAKSLGVKDSFNPEQNIHAGVKYFSQLLNKFNGDPSLALAAYNAGSRKVKKYKGVPPFKTTKRYIKKVFKYQKLFEQEMVDSG